ncbi:hypothetical protein BDA99DRAFT_34981 [Phascolomyces articulosus]|uniref:CHHC U11-48K-type domain-containing protein n=1 Tax=Phascolomyces articulosus TaxID=60185 RepID=A0AAD5PFG5_9FUNG|nr:hypothetical protein BDA99DRAFT_34981 [Phascolomyces articulosus]
MSNDQTVWIHNTRQRIHSINTKMDTILTALHWNRDDLKQWYSEEQEKLVCPHDERHVIPQSQWQKHAEHCLAKKQNQPPPPPPRADHQQEQKRKKQSTSKTKRIGGRLPSSARYFYSQAPCVISFTNDQSSVQRGPHVHPIVPGVDYAELANSIRAQHDIPSVLNVHDFLQNEEQETLEDEEHNKKEDGAEDQKERDFIKRRRKTYRVKVSKHRSATETQRELVQAYMKEFQ